MTRSKSLTGLLSVLLILTGWSTACGLQAAETPKTLLSFVGDDVGLCIEIHNLEKSLSELQKSEAFRRLKTTQAYRGWHTSGDFAKVEAAVAHIEKLTGKQLSALAGDLFGKSVVLAVYPSMTGEPGGVFLTRARNRAALDAALAAWQLAAPKDTVKEVKLAGNSYFRRDRPQVGEAAPKAMFYTRLDDVFAISDRELLIRDIVKRSQANVKPANGQSSLYHSGRYRKARQSLKGDPVVMAYFNPRRWDAVIRFDDDASPGTALARQLWKQCRSVMVGIRLDRGFVAEVVADFNPNGLPTAWTRFATLTAGDSDFLTRVPSDAVAAFAAKIDPQLLSHAIRGQLKNRKDARGLGRAVLANFDVTRDLLPNMEKNVGWYVLPRPTSNKNVFPFDGLVAMEITGKSKTRGREFRTKFDKGVANGITFLTTMYNISIAKQAGNVLARIAAVRSEKQHGTLIRWIDQVGEYQPAIAMTDRYIVVASSPDLIADFVSPSKKNRLTTSDDFLRWKRMYFPADNQMVFLNVRGLGDHLKSVKPVMISWLRKSDSLSAEQAATRLDGLLDLLHIADAAFAAGHIGNSRLRLVIGGVASPAKKRP